MIVSGVGIFFSLTATPTIGPFILLLHLVWAIAVSAWVLNIRINLKPEKKALLAVGTALCVGSAWSSVQQWLAYFENGVLNDILLVAGAMIMDVAGGTISYFLYRLNILKK